MKYSKVSRFTDSRIRLIIEAINAKFRKLSLYSSPNYLYYFYSAKEFIKPFKKYGLTFIVLFITLFGLKIIDARRNMPITPSESTAMILQLMNMSFLIIGIALWGMHVKSNKVPIYR